MQSSLSHRLHLLFVCLVSAPAAGLAQVDEGIRLTAESIGVFGTVGGPTTQQLSIGVTVSDPACDDFVVKGANVPWLTIQPRSAIAPSGVFITIDYSQFAPNETKSTVATFESLDAPLSNGFSCLDPALSDTGTVVIFRQDLPITAQLLPAGPRPVPYPSPQILNLSDTTGSQQPISTFLDITNVGDGSFNYSFDVSYSGAAVGWLSVNPTGGTVASEPKTHQVIANPAGLAAGAHSAVLRLLHDASGAPTITIPVSLTISGPPRFSVLPAEIKGIAKRGKQNPNTVLLEVKNTGGGTLDYQIASSQPWMTVSPAQGQSSSSTPVTHSVTFNALNLPVGLQTATLTISTNTPGVPNNPVTVPVSIDVQPGGTISVLPAEVQVSAAAGSTEPRQIRLRLESPALDKLQWRASVEPANVQWLRLLDRGGSLPGTIVAEIDPTVIPRPVLVSAGIVVEAFDPNDVAAVSEESPEQSSSAIIKTIIPVRLQATSQAPELSVAPSRIELIATGVNSLRVQPISISMGGGGPGIAWQATLEPHHGAAQGAFSLAPASGSGPGIVTVTGDPAGLAAGVYDADVVIRAGSVERRVPVAMLVAAAGQSIVSTGQTALALRGSAATLHLEVPVANLGPGVDPNIEVRATTLTGAGWLGSPSTTVNGFQGQALGAGLAAGVRHGLLEIRAPGASNSPQYLPVVYERHGPGAAAELLLDRGGLVFTSVGGAAVPGRSITIRTTSDGEARALVGVATDTNVAWLAADPVDGQASARTPMTVNVQANPSGLAPGVHRGRVTVAIPGGPSQSVQVTLIVAPASCTPTQLVLAPLAPPEGFRATIGHPVTVEAGLLDNCGFPVGGGVVVDGAARGAILRDMGEAGAQARGPEIFRGTMFFPTAGEAQVQLRAAANGLGTAERRLTGTAVAGSDGATSRSATPPVHAATFGLGRPLAPGSIATVFGTGFPTPAQQPSALPLPESLSGFSAQVGGRPAPLFFLNSTQANLQIPVETPANTLVQSLVRVNDVYLPAETFLSSAAQPGLFALSAGRAVVVNQNGAVNTPLNAARRGEVIVAYLTGIGATLPASITGQGAPSVEPFARPALAASATIGGAEAEILFLGMTPGFVGLTQANLTISNASSTGAEVPIVVEVGGYRSPEMLIAVEP